MVLKKLACIFVSSFINTMVKFYTALSISGEDERKVQLREKSLIKQTEKKQILETKAGRLET